MSEELLQKFLKSIEQEDGITEVGKKKKKCKRVAERENVKTVLQAASKGHVQLSAEESYIVQKPSTSKGTDYIDDRLASQGFSLIDQARSYKPKDLKKRNLKYMKYQEGRRLDPKKGRVIVAAHMKTKADLKDLRKQKKVVVANAQTRMDANEEAQLYLQRTTARHRVRAEINDNAVSDKDMKHYCHPH